MPPHLPPDLPHRAPADPPAPAAATSGGAPPGPAGRSDPVRPAGQTDPVTTSAGQVVGTAGARALVFRGIPYAAAPVGDLRFAAPEPHPGWPGVRETISNGPTPTLGPPADAHSVPEHPVPGDERLNLNIFTPTTDTGAKLPVYVWLHGGGYVGGAPGGEWFDGTSFATRGIVTVTITYRLGMEGYGHIPGAPDNRGVLDQIAALEWVQRNIAAFGGDPAQVTVGGQSAGAGSVLALLATPATTGLFSRAISHSAPLPDIDPGSAAAVGLAMAKICGVEHTVAGWSGLSREQIVVAERTLQGSGVWAGLRSLSRTLRERDPVIWFGPVLGAEPLGPDILSDLGAADRPLLLGATSHEFNKLAGQINQGVSRGFTPMVLSSFGIPAVRARAYPAAYPDLSGLELVGQAITDRVFRYPVMRIATARGHSSAPTWVWDFRWRSPVTGQAGHCLDLPFAWHNLDAERVARSAGDDPPAALAEQMHTALCSFITDGDPGWAQHTPAEPVARVFDAESWTGRDPYRFERIAVQRQSRR